jgi:hypothetical protein
MFLRYTHLGVGHPVALRRIARHCFDYKSTSPVEAMDIDEVASDGEGHNEDNDEQQMNDDLGEESEDEHDYLEVGGDEESNESELDGLGEREEVEEESDDLYF